MTVQKIRPHLAVRTSDTTLTLVYKTPTGRVCRNLLQILELKGYWYCYLRTQGSMQYQLVFEVSMSRWRAEQWLLGKIPQEATTRWTI
jgi:hypothetical protein